MEEVIKKYFQCWLDKDVDAVKEIFSDDIIYSECYGPVYKGILTICLVGRCFESERIVNG